MRWKEEKKMLRIAIIIIIDKYHQIEKRGTKNWYFELNLIASQIIGDGNNHNESRCDVWEGEKKKQFSTNLDWN